MNTPASIRGHPIHAMLVPIAVGGFVLSFAFDLAGVLAGTNSPWGALAYHTMIGGILGALLAALPGFVDMLSIPAGPVKRTALLHMAINLAVVALFAWNAWLRHGHPPELGLPIALSGLGVLLLAVSGWLGGKMVFESGVGVRSHELGS